MRHSNSPLIIEHGTNEARTYRYENGLTGFSAELTVDPCGLVVSYPQGREQLDRSRKISPLLRDTSSPELADEASHYRSLIGRWDVDVIDFEDDGTRRTSRREWHFGWALAGALR